MACVLWPTVYKTTTSTAAKSLLYTGQSVLWLLSGTVQIFIHITQHSDDGPKVLVPCSFHSSLAQQPQTTVHKMVSGPLSCKMVMRCVSRQCWHSKALNKTVTLKAEHTEETVALCWQFCTTPCEQISAATLDLPPSCPDIESSSGRLHSRCLDPVTFWLHHPTCRANTTPNTHTINFYLFGGTVTMVIKWVEYSPKYPEGTKSSAYQKRMFRIRSSGD